jgi:hypothetical protein
MQRLTHTHTHAEYLAQKAQQKRREAEEEEAALQAWMESEGHLYRKKNEEQNNDDNTQTHTHREIDLNDVVVSYVNGAVPGETVTLTHAEKVNEAYIALGVVDWLPYYLRMALARSGRRAVVEEGDVKVLREEVFGLESFYVTGVGVCVCVCVCFLMNKKMNTDSTPFFLPPTIHLLTYTHTHTHTFRRTSPSTPKPSFSRATFAGVRLRRPWRRYIDAWRHTHTPA